MVLPRKSWFVVADGAKASIFVRDGRDGTLEPVIRMDSPAAQSRTGDIVADRAGRVGESASAARHAYAPRTDPHRHAEEVFVKSVADYVGAHVSDGSFDRLVLVAPPRVLGQLRRDLPRQAREMTTAELEKDLVHMSDEAIAGHIAVAEIS